MDISIIIVSWNVKDKLRENLKAIFNSKINFKFEVFVVDNSSQDGSTEMVKNEFPKVKLIANSKNLGFAGANNQAIKMAQGEFVLLLNPDMKVFPDTLPSMLSWMKKNQQAGVAGCCLFDRFNDIVKHVRRFPTILNQAAIVLKLPHLFPGILNYYLFTDFDYSRAAKVDSVRGSFFMFRRKIIEKVGLLDERYFLWFEEVDFCRRVKKAGLEVWYTPTAKCIDYVGQSFKQIPLGKTQKYFRNSMLLYFKKWRPYWQYLVLKIIWPLGIIIAKIGGRINIKSQAET